VLLVRGLLVGGLLGCVWLLAGAGDVGELVAMCVVVVELPSVAGADLLPRVSPRIMGDEARLLMTERRPLEPAAAGRSAAVG